MTFCTAITCMDGRVQLPVIQYLQKRFKAEWVDTITEPGPNLILAEEKPISAIKSIHHRLNISVNGHGSVGIAIIGHHDCAGNPADENDQKEHVRQSVKFIKNKQEIDVIGIWVDSNWKVHEL